MEVPDLAGLGWKWRACKLCAEEMVVDTIPPISVVFSLRLEF